MEKYLNKFYDFIDKIGKHNFILIIFIFFVLIVTGLYQTFSLYTESEGLSILNGLDTYSFILDANNKSNSVVIVDGASKNIDITIRNDSEVPLKYGLYSSKESNSDTNFIFGYSTISKHLPSGVIPAKTDYVITLKVYNYSGDNQIVNFGVQYGFENGVDLTLDSNQYWIEPLHLMKNLFKTWDSDYNYFKIDEYRNDIVTASFVDLDTIDSSVSIENATKAWNISVYGESDESVKAWIVPSSEYEKSYDLYIGSKEKIYAESLYGLFSKMELLESIDFSNLDTSLVKDMAFLFRGCFNLSSIDLSDFDTSNVTNMWSMFGGCKSLTQLDVGSFDTSKVTSMRTMFLDCSSLTNLDLSSFNTSNVTEMTQMFETCSKLSSLDVSNFDTSKITNMRLMFNGCSSLISLDVSNFITNNVTDMGWMFNSCSSLTSLDVSNFNTHKVTKLDSMFNGCSSLISLDISNFDTRKVTNMESMFNGCSSLTSLDVSNFGTSNVTNMQFMFRMCSSLVELDISNFNTHKVTNMGSMFNGCSSMFYLRLNDNFDITNVVSFDYMFYQCYNLSTNMKLRKNSSISPSYTGMFHGTSTADGAQILVYYDNDTKDLVEGMVGGKSATAHVYAVIELAKMRKGSYVKYVGDSNNGCDNTTTVNGYTACSGKNANASIDNNGYCENSSYEFNTSGWRIGYIEDGSAYLVSAGATDCMSTDSKGISYSNSIDNYLEDISHINEAGQGHFINMNNIALKYCNKEYSKGGICDETTVRAMKDVDFDKIVDNSLGLSTCYQVSNNDSCGYTNDLIDNGGCYWFATPNAANIRGAFIWFPNYAYISQYNSSLAYGVRPIIALDSSVVVTGGSGTETDPYIIIRAIKYLNEVEPGAYVKYVGNNGCVGKSCEGYNANYVDNTNKGYCASPSYKFNANGWRVGYVEDGSAHLVSAGATDCMATASDGTISDVALEIGLSAGNLYKHFNNMNNIALKYCNKDYIKEGLCDSTTVRAMNASDFEMITGSPLNSSSCIETSSEACGKNNSIIDNGGFYWFATPYNASSDNTFCWDPNYRYGNYTGSNALSGVRPVLVLESSIRVVGGSGTEDAPYIIAK